MSLTNAELAELLARAAEREADHRARALRTASRAAMFRWPEEAAAVAEAGRSLSELPRIGPWTARIIHGWLEEPPEVPDPPPDRRGFMTLTEARAELARDPGLAALVRGDLQVHTTNSDGGLPLPSMADQLRSRGYEYACITDHSQGLAIANGMDEVRLAGQGAEIAALNEGFERDGQSFRLLHGIEMNLTPAGEGDMDPQALAKLDLVLGAFHSKLRLREDQTERYVAGLRNPTIHVLAHPRCRMYGRRVGLSADWPAVFAEAARLGKAVEVDGTAHRQDLDAGLLALARDAGATISLGTDAHVLHELEYIEFALAAVIRAGFPRERILNLMPREDLVAWAADVRGNGPPDKRS